MSQPAVHNPYLGSRISLISKAKIRYEGILYAIDTDAMTVALTKVRSFGTENRCPDRPIGPRDEIFEYIIFRGTDICDLNVCDLPTDRFPQDPAILSATPVRPNDGGFPGQSASPAAPPSAQPGADGADEKQQVQGERPQRNNQRQNQNNQNYENRRNNQGQNNQRFQRNNQKAANNQTGKTEQYKEDFDFESANAEFESIRKELFENLKISTNEKEEKGEVEEEEPESGEIVDEEKESTEYYNKSTSFFDNISCEATDPHGERITRSAERKLNSETFGISGNQRGYGRRGGYNKRGGRDNFNRNNQRGGYNNNRRNNQQQGNDNRNWRSGHDNRADTQRGNWRNNNNRGGGGGNWRNNNRGGGADGGNWRGGGRGGRGGGGNWGNNRRNQHEGGEQQQQQQRQQRNNRNREWVDYEYDVSKARQESAQEA